MSINREILFNILEKIGKSLEQETTICLIGSTPGIANGQPDRQSSDLDVWKLKSNFIRNDLEKACKEANIYFDPKKEINSDDIYIQIINQGIIKLPIDFEIEEIGIFGKLKVIMPTPSLIAALKLIRADERDIEDIIWWIKERNLTIDEINENIEKIPDKRYIETAKENIILVEMTIYNKDFK